MSERLQITRVRGDDWTVRVTVDEKDAAGITTPYDAQLDDCEMVSTLRARMGGAEAWSGTKTGGEITLVEESIGTAPRQVVTITVPSEVTETLTSTVYVMDLELTHTPSGTRLTPIVLTVRVVQDVTTH